MNMDDDDFSGDDSITTVSERSQRSQSLGQPSLFSVPGISGSDPSGVGMSGSQRLDRMDEWRFVRDREGLLGQQTDEDHRDTMSQQLSEQTDEIGRAHV